MKIRCLILAAFFILLSQTIENISAREQDGHPFSAELEVGSVWQSRNSVQIPNDENGTRFSLVDLVGKGPQAAIRLYFSWRFREKHALRALLAPLSYTGQGRFSHPVEFAGGSFDPDVDTDATYKFNSWRVTYRYLLFERSRWDGWIGFTAKIRDAKIQLDQEADSARKTDLGFVPLFHMDIDYKAAQKWLLSFDLDALAGGPGRAEDVSLKLRYMVNKKLSIACGYRTVEGGADVEEVYNFAWLHYVTASLFYEF